MALRTAFTELLALRHPIALAPMGGSAGGALAAAVSEGGGLGLVGGGRGDPAWLDRELGIAAEGTARPWGVGFLAWAVETPWLSGRWPAAQLRSCCPSVIPDRWPARALRHPWVDRWRGREEELAADAGARQAYQDDVAAGALPPVPVWASEAIDLITDVRPAAELVGTLGAEAEAALARAAGRGGPVPG